VLDSRVLQDYVKGLPARHPGVCVCETLTKQALSQPMVLKIQMQLSFSYPKTLQPFCCSSKCSCFSYNPSQNGLIALLNCLFTALLSILEIYRGMIEFRDSAECESYGVKVAKV